MAFVLYGKLDKGLMNIHQPNFVISDQELRNDAYWNMAPVPFGSTCTHETEEMLTHLLKR